MIKLVLLVKNITSSGSPSGVEANVLFCDIVGNEFELYSRYYVPYGLILVEKV